MIKLKTKSYAPVGDTIWVEVDLDAVADGIVMPGTMKLPPFVHANVLAVGPKCVQVKAGDVVLVNSSTVTRMKVGQEPEALFTKEPQVVAVVKPAVE